MSINSTYTHPFSISSGSKWTNGTVTSSTGINALSVTGDATITGTLFAKDYHTVTSSFSDLIDRIEKIEKRLEMLTPNSELEKEWSQLRELRESYEKLEQEIKDKMQVYNILKSST
jgi:hypothetical protein